MKDKIVLVLDGHDGSGKTTLAKALALELGAAYLKPFDGTKGELLLRAAGKGKTDFVAQLAWQLIEKVLNSTDASIVVFDRHWMTAFSLLPEEYWPIWKPLPPTILCWADLKTTLARLASRPEKQYSQSYHYYYLKLYWKLYQECGGEVLRTDRQSPQECLDWLVKWARLKIAGGKLSELPANRQLSAR